MPPADPTATDAAATATDTDTADTGPSARRRGRRPIIIGAIAAVVVLAAAGVALAVYVSAPGDSGIAACQRVDRAGRDLAGGGRPILTPDELDEIADDLASSENEVLSHFGREYLRWELAGDPDRFKGAQGALNLHSQVLPACMVAGVDMTTSN